MASSIRCAWTAAWTAEKAMGSEASVRGSDSKSSSAFGAASSTTSTADEFLPAARRRISASVKFSSASDGWPFALSLALLRTQAWSSASCACTDGKSPSSPAMSVQMVSACMHSCAHETHGGAQATRDATLDAMREATTRAFDGAWLCIRAAVLVRATNRSGTEEIARLCYLCRLAFPAVARPPAGN
eukprot:4180171-Pleurochrysis_carterae.AAC.2